MAELLAPDPAPVSGTGGVHATAAEGFARNAGDYERARPGYPPEAVAFLADRLGLGPGRTVVDVGAGTGKLTRLLVPTGATVVAVEPVAAMREELARQVPAAVVSDATADRLPLEDGAADGVVCAQSFHWFDTEEVLAEFARVLRPGRRLALVWNLRDRTVPWVQELTDLLAPYEGDRPDHNRGHWRRLFGAGAPFGPLETSSFALGQPMTPDLLVSRAASMSFVATLPEGTRGQLLEAVRRLGARQGPEFVLPYRTDVHLAERR